jgi:hypothetical protein
MKPIPKYSAEKKPTHKPNAPRRVGLKGIEDIDPRVTITKEVANQGAGLAVWLIKGSIVCLGLYFVYSKFTNRFISLKQNSKYPKANITDAVAKTRADAIISSLAFFDYTGNEFDVTSNAIAGLNYNGFILLYNAFGKQSGHLFKGSMNLIEWINDQFSATQISQLSFLLGGAFFRSANSTKKNQQLTNEQIDFLQLFNKTKI